MNLRRPPSASLASGVFWTLLLFVVALPVEAGERETTVELRCKIVRKQEQHRLRSYQIELLRYTGEPVRKSVCFAGSSIRFKDLKPAIYVLCIFGEKGRRYCESIDLVPPQDNQACQFVKELDEPVRELNRSDANRVHVTSLAVPKAAVQELVRAEDAQLRGDSNLALQHLENAIRIYPTYSDALNNLGTHYHRARKYDLAIRQFTRVTEIAPDSYVGWVNLGGSLISAGQFRSALEASIRAFSLAPENAHVVSQLALSNYYLRNYADAKRYFAKAAELDPSAGSFPHLFLAHIALAEHNQSEAQDYMRTFLKLHPNAPQATRLRMVLQDMGQADAALSRTLISSGP